MPATAAQIRAALVTRALELAGRGIRETHGQNRGEPFDTWNRSAGQALGSPYCVSIWHCEAGRVFERLGVQQALTIGASSGALVTAASKAKRIRTAEQAAPGDLVVYYSRGKAYHTGMVIERLPDGRLITVEGNTSSGSNVEGEGNGVFLRVRDPGNIPVKIVNLIPWGTPAQ